MNELESLKKENEKLKKVLEIYADSSNWTTSDYYDVACHYFMLPNREDRYADGWMLARDALKIK